MFSDIVYLFVHKFRLAYAFNGATILRVGGAMFKSAMPLLKS